MSYREEAILAVMVVLLLAILALPALGQSEQDLYNEYMLSAKGAITKYETYRDAELVAIMWETNVYCHSLLGVIEQFGLLGLTMQEAGNLGRCAALDLTATHRGLRHDI